jgi:hypothetical protein
MKHSNFVRGTFFAAIAVFSVNQTALARGHDAPVGVATPIIQQAFVPMLFGSVKADCSTINAGSGGWSCKKLETGFYRIDFDPALPRSPICQAAATATKKEAAADDNVFTTYRVGRTNFHVESIDVAGNGSEGWAFQDASFNFLCVWAP